MKKINKILLELYDDRKQLLFLSFLGYISYLTKDIIPLDPNVIQCTGWIAGAMALGTLVTGYLSYSAQQDASDAMDANLELTETIATENLAFQKEQQKKLDAQKDVYRAMEFKNPYAENVFEDLTVNLQQAEFQAEQGAQQRANIMQQFRGAAGASGIAGLAQSLARQGQLQTQQASASIGQQEAMNQRLMAQGAMQKQQGEAMLQTMEMDRQATLLGISMGESAGANQAAMQAQMNQMSLGANQANMYGQQSANWAGLAGESLSMAGQIMAADQTPVKDTAELDSCFMKGAKITMFDGTVKSIENIKLNDEIKNINGDKEIVINTIVHDIDDVMSIYTNGIIRTTDKHPLFINNKWTNAKELEWDNEPTFIDKLYNLEIKGDTNTFIVDNIVVSGLVEHVSKEVELKQI